MKATELHCNQNSENKKNKKTTTTTTTTTLLTHALAKDNSPNQKGCDGEQEGDTCVIHYRCLKGDFVTVPTQSSAFAWQKRRGICLLMPRQSAPDSECCRQHRTVVAVEVRVWRPWWTLVFFDRWQSNFKLNSAPHRPLLGRLVGPVRVCLSPVLQ